MRYSEIMVPSRLICRKPPPSSDAAGRSALSFRLNKKTDAPLTTNDRSMAVNRMILHALLAVGVFGVFGPSPAGGGTASAHGEEGTPPLPSPATLLQSQIWNVVDSPLDAAIMKGLHGVGMFLLGWFCVMCVIGTAMRCYLCCDKLRSGDRDWRSLYDSFADGEESHDDDDSSTAAYENEEEGIALDALSGGGTS